MKKTILLVDDEPYILQSLKRLLSAQGYEVLTTTNGYDGLKLLENLPIQLVISDQRMPLMKGSAFLKKVRNLYPDIICMLLSSFVDFEAIKESINEGAIYKFISKPWQDNVLLQYVHDAFETRVKKKEIKPVYSEHILVDRLTGLPNRFSFYESLCDIINLKKTHNYFAVVYFDIDRFTKANELFGQKKADFLLKLLANRLRLFIKNEKNLARLGNDEFVVIITEARELAELNSMLKMLFSIIKNPVTIDEKKHYLTASMGVCLYPEHGKSADLLMKNASVALRHSQELGGDNYQIYETYIDQTKNQLLILEDELYEALEKKQFIIYYQPIYNMDKSKIMSVEALLRWQHPKHGLLLPVNFLKFCEETNLIVPIGAWVLRAACQQVKLWHDLGFSELVLAVNFSVRQFNHPRLLDLIIDVLETTQLPPCCLELEITETLIMQNPDSVNSLLNILRGLGVQLALDDFGTGYSSLSYLRQFPFTHLKLDRSFITDMVTGGSGKAIVETIISLGKILGIKVIAEGVETEEQLELLQGKQCDYIQGFVYSKPLLGRDLEHLLLTQNNKAGT
jgi:diguanylate cyclase (GGDEF)-like protein